MIEGAHDAAAACGIHVGDANDVAGADTDTARPLVGVQRGEELDDLAVHVECDEPAAAGIECGDRTRVILDCALECERGSRFEPEEKAPQRPNKQRLEHDGADERRAELKPVAERLAEQSARTESDEEGEQYARGEERLETCNAMIAGMTIAGVYVVASMTMTDVHVVTCMALPVAAAAEVCEAEDRHRDQPYRSGRERHDIEVHAEYYRRTA